MGMGQMFRARALPSFAAMASGIALSLPLAIGLDEPATAQDSNTDFAKPSAATTPMVESPGFAVLADIRSARMDLINADTRQAASHLQKALDLLNLSLSQEKSDSLADGAEIWVRVGAQVLVGDPSANRSAAGADTSPQQTIAHHEISAQMAPVAPPPVALVTFTEILLPVNGTRSRVLRARALMAQNKYYEANGLLSRIEADLRVRSTSLTPEDLGKSLGPSKK